MNVLLIFFILPLATIIISAILETVLNNPVAVAAFVFAIAIVIVFIAFSPADLIYAIVYTVLAYIVALITCAIMRLCRNNDADDEEENCACGCMNTLSANNINNTNVGNASTNNSCGCGNTRFRRF